MNDFLLAVLIAALVMSITLIPLARRRKQSRNVNNWRTIVLGILFLAATAAMFYPAFSGK